MFCFVYLVKCVYFSVTHSSVGNPASQAVRLHYKVLVRVKPA